MSANPHLNAKLRGLPSVDRLLAGADALIARYGRDAVTDALRDEVNAARAALIDGSDADTVPDALLARAADALAALYAPTLRPVINATGVIIHTNLGRAPLSDAALQAMFDAAQGYSTLEFDLENGKRGSRTVHAEALIRQVTGAEAALVVNNNAAATVLMLAALAQGRQVIVSRGQLVEIGGGFRVPDIMRQSGAALIEVGTTNRTRARDYEAAVTPETAMLLRVHSSNFKQIGFTEETPLAEMHAIAARHGIVLADDLGSGALIDTALYGLDHEPTVQESLAAGVDVVAFSGDKLLGGPQAGILAGKRAIIEVLKRHPLARAIRADKLCLAALTATLEHYRAGDALEKVPVWRMIASPLDALRETAVHWRDSLPAYVKAAVIDGESTVGGGSLPGATLPTALLALDVPAPDAFMARLRATPTPVIARILNDRVVFDPRTVFQHQHAALLEAIIAAWPPE